MLHFISMLNPFPIQFLSLFAFALLRLFVGGILLYLGSTHLRNRGVLKKTLSVPWFPYGLLSVWIFGLVEILFGAMLILGLYTQIAALGTMIMSLKLIVLNKWFESPHIPDRIFYTLLFAAALSLFITGAGVLAFDLPI